MGTKDNEDSLVSAAWQSLAIDSKVDGKLSISSSIDNNSNFVNTNLGTSGSAITVPNYSPSTISVSPYISYWSDNQIDTDALIRGCELNRFKLTTTKGGEQLTEYGQKVFDELNAHASNTLTKNINRFRCDILTHSGKLVLSMIYGYVFPISTTNTPVYVCDQSHIDKVIVIGNEVIDYYTKIEELYDSLQAKLSILCSFSC